MDRIEEATPSEATDTASESGSLIDDKPLTDNEYLRQIAGTLEFFKTLTIIALVLGGVALFLWIVVQCSGPATHL